jgi:hypothetical protein
MPGIKDLLEARTEMVERAQEVLDDWEQDEDGIDEVYGGGGPCDDIARALGDVAAEWGFDVALGGAEGDDHAFIYAYTEQKAWIVDIPPSVYETGGGYRWRKIEDVELEEDDILIEEIPLDWVIEEEW